MVWGLGFRAVGLRKFRVWGLELRVRGLGVYEGVT